MTPRRPLLRTLWFALVALIGCIGFGLQFYLLFTGGSDINSGESGNAVPLGTRFVRLFSFFTIQSNVFVLVASVLLAWGARRALWSRVIAQDAVLGIAVTGLVFSFVLDPSIELRGLATVVTTLFHNVIPIAFIIGWLLFAPRRLWNARSTAWAFLWPLLWLGATFSVGHFTAWYPYPFLDVSRVGWGGAVTGAAIVVVLALVLTAIMLVVDRWLPSVTPDRPETDHRGLREPSGAAS